MISPDDLLSQQPQPDPSQQGPQQQPQPQGQQPQPGPVKTGLRGLLTQIMHNIAGGGLPGAAYPGDMLGEAHDKHQAALAHMQADTALTQAQADVMKNTVPFTLPNGSMIYLPQNMAVELMKQQMANQGKTDTAQIGAGARTDAAQIGAESRTDVAKINQGQGIPVDPTVANLIGMPEMSNVAAGKGTWENINKALQAKGYKAQDLGQDGVWLLDRGGNKIKQLGQSPSIGRANAFATARAANTPFETVDDAGNPKTISAAQALQTGAPGIGKTNLTQVKGKQALIDDIRGGIDQVRQLTGVIDRPGVKVKVAAALADPSLTTQTVLQSPIVGSMQPDEQQYVINLLNLKENAMAMRSVLGAGQGSEDVRTAITKTIPNAMTPNSKYANAQLDTFLNTLGRLEKGIPQVKAPGAAPTKPNAPPTASGFNWGSAPVKK